VIGVTSQGRFAARPLAIGQREPPGATFGLLWSFIAQSIEMIINTGAQRRLRRQGLRFREWMLGFRLNETFGRDKASVATEGHEGARGAAKRDVSDNLRRELASGEAFLLVFGVTL
jgi:hypothetical protein